jgi:hypothetical protein
MVLPLWGEKYVCKNRKMLELRMRHGRQIWGTRSALRIAAVAVVLAAACLRFRSFHQATTRLAAIQAAEYAFIIFISVALIVLYAGFAGRWRLHRFFCAPELIWLSAILIYPAVYKLGTYQFGGFDEGLLVHAANYYAQGFKPYADFPCTMPPFFMACIRWDVKLLGLRWVSLLFLPAMFATLTSLWSFGLLRCAAVPRHWALAIIVCVEACTMLTIPFWWYNNSSYIAVVLLLLSVLACLQGPKQWLPWISLPLSLAMVLGSKPNVLPACLMVLVLLATKDKRQWAKTLAAGAIALGLFLLVCYAAQMPLTDLLHSYAEVAKLRGSPLSLVPFHRMAWPERDFQYLFTILNVLGFAALLAVSVRRQPKRWRQLAVCTIATATALLMACTNAESKHSDLSILLTAAAFLCLRPWKNTEPGARRKTVLASFLIVSLVMSALFCFTHLRIYLIGEGTYYELLPTRTIQSGFFAGLRAGPRLQRVLAQSEEVLSRYPAKTVFFGPRVEFEYAVFNQPLIPGMPLLWDTGNLFPRERLLRMLLTFQRADPDLLIFLKDDYTRMELVGFYIEHTNTYQRIDSFGELTVYVRKREVPISYVQIPQESLP